MRTEKNTKLKRRLALIIGMAMALSICSATPAMAKTKTMTVYNEVYKTGKIVYCASGLGVHKVYLKTGKVRKLASGNWSSSMKKKGNYLYYQNNYAMSADLSREKITNGKKKTLAENGAEDAIAKNKIYYTKHDEQWENMYKRVMSINGNNKKKTSVKAKMKYKRSNAKGYKIIQKYVNDSGVIKFWLKTPSGKKYYLGKGVRY